VSKLKRHHLIRILLLSYLLAVVLMYVLPVNTKGELNTQHVAGLRLDYLLHALLFLPLPVLLIDPKAKPGKFVLLFVAAVCVAGVTEYIHALIPYRSFNPNDLLANVCGAVIGGLLVVVYRLLRRNG
jgi:VanZ family protein